jgi:hypothetical protein
MSHESDTDLTPDEMDTLLTRMQRRRVPARQASDTAPHIEPPSDRDVLARLVSLAHSAQLDKAYSAQLEQAILHVPVNAGARTHPLALSFAGAFCALAFILTSMAVWSAAAQTAHASTLTPAGNFAPLAPATSGLPTERATARWLASTVAVRIISAPSPLDTPTPSPSLAPPTLPPAN